MDSQRHQKKVKHKQPRQGFEIGSPILLFYNDKHYIYLLRVMSKNINSEWNRVKVKNESCPNERKICLDKKKYLNS